MDNVGEYRIVDINIYRTCVKLSYGARVSWFNVKLGTQLD